MLAAVNRRKLPADARVAAVHRSPEHCFSKQIEAEITLVAGHGVEGDAHQELFEEVAAGGHTVSPGDLGENVTTAGTDLSALSPGAPVPVDRV